MMCPNCGKEILNDVESCPYCGSNFPNSNNVESIKELEINSLSNKKSKKTNRSKFIVIGALCVISVIILFLYFFLKPKASSKDVFDNMITYVVDNVEKAIPNKTDSVSQNYSFKANVDLNKDILEPEVYSFINNLEFKGTTAVDYKNKNIFTKLSLLYKEASLLDLTAYESNNNVYANLGELFSKYISIPIDGNYLDKIFDMYSSSTQIDDFKVMLNEIETGLKKSLKEEYLKNEKDVLMISNKEVDTVKHTLVLNEKTATIIARDLLSYLNNDKFLDSYTKIYNYLGSLQEVEEEFDIRTSIKTAIDELNAEIEANQFTEENKAYISIFVDSNSSFVSLTVSYMDSGDKELTLLDITKLSKEKYSFELTDTSNFKICDGEVTLTDKEENYSVRLNLGNGLLNANKLSVNVNVLHGNADTYNVTINSDMFGTVKLFLTNSYNNSSQITLPDLSNSVLYTELTEEEVNAILQKLMQKESFNNLMEDIQGLITLFSSLMQ